MQYVWHNDKFLNKILFIILLFIFILMICVSPAFASNSIIINDTEYEVSDFISSFDNVLITHLPTARYHYVFLSNSSFLLDKDKGYLYSSDYSSIYYYAFWDGNTSLSTGLLADESKFIYNECNPSNGFVFNGSGVASGSNIIYSSMDIIDYTTNDILYPGVVPSFINPSFVTTEAQLSTGNFETLKIDAGDLDNADSENINFFIYDITDREFDLSTISELPNLLVGKKRLNFASEYIYYSNGEKYYYIPQSDLGIDLSNNRQYFFVLCNDNGDMFDSVVFTVGGLTADEELQNKQDQTNEKLDEANETNKGIWETIKDILSYINPFSENFFVYKLIELLIEAIKTLFIPSNDFFSNYFTNLKDWFSDRLGFLFYPFEIVIDILNRILNIDFSEPVFNIPDINEPFTNNKLISAKTFNFNDLLSNNVLSNIHNIYLICVDAFIVFGLIYLFRKKYEEVTTK